MTEENHKWGTKQMTISQGYLNIIHLILGLIIGQQVSSNLILSHHDLNIEVGELDRVE